MASKTETEQAATQQLWDQLDDAPVCMLSLRGSDGHPQPMTQFVDKDTGTVWFITSSDTHLVAEIGSGAAGQLTFMSPGDGYYASVQGHMSIVEDKEKTDELWSVFAAAWFEEGRDDPKVRLLRFDPSEAAIWANESNSVLVGLKLLQAGLSEGEDHPNVGVYHELKLDAA